MAKYAEEARQFTRYLWGQTYSFNMSKYTGIWVVKDEYDCPVLAFLDQLLPVKNNDGVVDHFIQNYEHYIDLGVTHE